MYFDVNGEFKCLSALKDFYGLRLCTIAKFDVIGLILLEKYLFGDDDPLM